MVNKKPKALPPRTQFGDAEDIAALRAAALRTKKPTVEPAVSKSMPTPQVYPKGLKIGVYMELIFFL